MSSLAFDSQPRFFRRKLMLEFEQAPGLATSEAASCVYIAHMLLFTIIFIVAAGTEIKQPLQTINIEFASSPQTAPVSALPTASAAKDREYQMDFKKIFDGGRNVDATSRQGASSRPTTKISARPQQPLNKTDSPLPVKLPSPHYARRSFSLPSPTIARPPERAASGSVTLPVPVNRTLPVPVPPLPVPVIPDPASPLPELPAISVFAGPSPQSVLRSTDQPEPAPLNQTDWQPQLAPEVVSAQESEFPVPLPATVSSAAQEAPAPTKAGVAQSGSLFAFAPKVPFPPTRDALIDEDYRNPCPGYDWGPFMHTLQKRIALQLRPDTVDGFFGHTIVVRFKVHSDGRVFDLHLLRSAAEKSVNDSVLSAIERAAPVGSFPALAGNDSVDVEFTFDSKFVYERWRQEWPALRYGR